MPLDDTTYRSPASPTRLPKLGDRGTAAQELIRACNHTLAPPVSVVVTDSGMAARDAYDALAPHYDFFTRDHDYEAWTEALEALLHAEGVSGRHLLDVACGTGNSFLPLLPRGWTVTGCDISAAMVREAARKAPEVSLHVCDMTRLPRLGTFDVVWCLDDALNYVLDETGLQATFCGMRRNLRPGGLLLFDVNALASYRGFFAATTVVQAEGQVVVWEGGCDSNAAAGVRAEATVTAYTRRRDGSWHRTRSVHRQQHHPRPTVEAALTRAGFTSPAVYGQGLDGRPGPEVDELSHTKLIYVARAAKRARRREEVSRSDPHRASGSSRRDGRIHPEGQLTTARGAA